MKVFYHYFKNLINSNAFPFITLFLSSISFILGVQHVSFLLCIILGCLILVTQKNIAPLIPVIIAFIICIRDFNYITDLKIAIPLFSPVLICILFHLLKFKVNFKLGSLVLPIIIICIALLLGGLGSEFRQYFMDGFVYITSAGFVPLIVYLFFYPYLEHNEFFNLKSYVVAILIATGIAVSGEIISVRTSSLFNIYVDEKSYIWVSSWFNVGFCSYLINLAIAGCYYLMIKAKRILLPFLLICYFVGILAYSQADGSLGTTLILMPFILILLHQRVKKQNKSIVIYLLYAIILCGIALAIIVLSNSEYLQYVIKHFLNDTGRSFIYRDGYILFSSNPIFGGSLGGAYHVNNLHTNESGYIHSTLLEALYCMGIVGVIAYAFYFYKRFKIFMANDSDFNFCMLIGFISFQCFAMIDNAEFSFLTVIITLLTVSVEIINKSNSNEELPLIRLA